MNSEPSWLGSILAIQRYRNAETRKDRYRDTEAETAREEENEKKKEKEKEKESALAGRTVNVAA